MNHLLRSMLLSIVICGTGFSFCAQAEEVVGYTFGENSQEFTYPSEFKLSRNDMKPRNVFFPALASLVLPGFDQYWERQIPYAVGYSGVAVTGYGILSHYAEKLRLASDDREIELDSLDNDARMAMFGGLIAQGAGGMSAYHSFRTAAISHQRLTGKYSFLKEHDSIGDIFAAPFKFGFLARATTYVPLLVGLSLNVLIYDELTNNQADEHDTRSLEPADYFFLSAFSYNAGTHEEAVFRGWLFPMFHEMGLNKHLANVVQAGLFAALHISDQNKVPVVQFASGLLDGYITIRNGWSIQEAVFGHVWWNVMAFSTGYMVTEKMLQSNPQKVKRLFGEKPVELWLPLVQMSF